MKNDGQSLQRIAVAMGMIVLLCLAAFSATLGGLIQNSHRIRQQVTIRRGKLESPVMQLTLSAEAVPGCYLRKQNELLFDGLRYDIVSVQKEHKHFIFKVIPDFKEQNIHGLVTQVVHSLPAKSKYGAGFLSLIYWAFNPYNAGLNSDVGLVRTVFPVLKVEKLAGYTWDYAPPPDAAFV